jgi:hypothetical protein
VIKQFQRHSLAHHLVNDTGDQPLLSNISDFCKKFEMAPMGYLGALGNLIHEKNLKSLV